MDLGSGASSANLPATLCLTAAGWLYLAVVIDLYSRAAIGWSIKSSLARELALDALLMAIWRPRPTSEIVIHSDQGVQYGSDDWRRFCREHGLEVSMSRRGNGWENSVAEPFSSSLKKERARGRVYGSREEARSDVFDYMLPSALAPATRRSATRQESSVGCWRKAQSAYFTNAFDELRGRPGFLY